MKVLVLYDYPPSPAGLATQGNLMHKGFLQMLDMENLDNSIFDDFSSRVLEDRFEYLLANQASLKNKLIEKRDSLRGLINKEVLIVKNLLRQPVR